MKQLLMIIAVLMSVQTVNAATWQYLPENLVLVDERLNQDLYTFKEKIILFSIAKNKEVSHLQILNNICPKANGGFSCMAMPSVVLKATFTLVHTETDACGVETYDSNKVDVSDRFFKNNLHFAQIRVKDFSHSTCEMFYPADIQLELIDTTVDVESQKTEVIQSAMLFNYVKEAGSVNR